MIHTHDLTKVYKEARGKEVLAVDHINFEVKEGDIFGFLGQNGAGKTTTIKMLTTILLPTHGTALVAGYDILREPNKVKDNIGLLPENPGFYDEMKAMDQLDFYARFYRISKTRRKRHCRELLELVGLENDAQRKIGTFSLGMRKRLALAQALINDPDLLILDEPTGGLDPPGKRNFRELIDELNENGITIFLSSHILPEVEQMCSRVGIIHEGKIMATDTIYGLSKLIRKKVDIRLHIEVEQVPSEAMEALRGMQGVSNIKQTKKGIDMEVSGGEAVVPDVVNALVKKGARIKFVKTDEPDLEDIFRSITEGGKWKG
ncbi:MAG: ABC transporter ATP-binding protein [Thermoplasmata archaeon]|nr:MAG: ABC transporter ATP-binding protein [Thermoplasmata archaeon]